MEQSGPIYVFDADGVIFDGTMKIMGNVFSESLVAYGIPPEDALSFYLSTAGQPIEKQYGDALLRFGATVEDGRTVRKLTEYFQSNAYREMPQLYPDVIPAVEALRNRRMVVSTNTPQDVLTRRINYYGLNNYFKRWFGRGYSGITDKAHHKGSIIGYLGVSEEEFQRYGLLIGDGLHDMEIATEWGIKGIGRPTEGTTAEALMQAGAVETVENLAYLVELEKKLF
ncbi:MAG: HAD family hydrolase [Candidatus Aenigmarchaeota archaeon]|nr:HAD family hydrolase [Candidatus Aenigmarchaeota archaeon]